MYIPKVVDIKNIKDMNIEATIQKEMVVTNHQEENQYKIDNQNTNNKEFPPSYNREDIFVTLAVDKNGNRKHRHHTFQEENKIHSYRFRWTITTIIFHRIYHQNGGRGDCHFAHHQDMIVMVVVIKEKEKQNHSDPENDNIEKEPIQILIPIRFNHNNGFSNPLNDISKNGDHKIYEDFFINHQDKFFKKFLKGLILLYP